MNEPDWERFQVKYTENPHDFKGETGMIVQRSAEILEIAINSGRFKQIMSNCWRTNYQVRCNCANRLVLRVLPNELLHSKIGFVKAKNESSTFLYFLIFWFCNTWYIKARTSRPKDACRICERGGEMAAGSSPPQQETGSPNWVGMNLRGELAFHRIKQEQHRPMGV